MAWRNFSRSTDKYVGKRFVRGMMRSIYQTRGGALYYRVNGRKYYI